MAEIDNVWLRRFHWLLQGHEQTVPRKIHCMWWVCNSDDQEPYLQYYITSNLKIKEKWPDLWNFIDGAMATHKDFLEKRFPIGQENGCVSNEFRVGLGCYLQKWLWQSKVLCQLVLQIVLVWLDETAFIWLHRETHQAAISSTGTTPLCFSHCRLWKLKNFCGCCPKKLHLNLWML